MRYAVFFLLAWYFAGSSLASEPPNIVMIIADDHAWTDFGFMGNERVHTPNLDALALRSARFVNGYLPTSVCRPSLMTLLTGLYPHQHGVHFNHGPPGNAGYNAMMSRDEYHRVRGREFQLIGEAATLPQLLTSERGYRSLQTGKFWEGDWRNGGFTEGMTLFRAPPIDQQFGGLRVLASGQRVAHGNGDVGLQIGRRTMEPIFRFVDACTEQKQPWLVWYAPYLPHQPHDSPQRFYNLVRRHPRVEEHEVPYFAAIAQFDETVGQLMRHVESTGTLEQTLFVFVSDNGWRPSRNRQRNRQEEFSHTKRSKRAPFDDGLRTPILLRWDGIIEPRTHSELVSSIDIVPTLLAAAGVAKHHWSDLPGVDLMPVARGEAELDPQRAVFGAIYPGDATQLQNPAADVAYRWVRQGDLKLIVPHADEGARPWNDYVDTPVLFDVASDPSEQVDLSDLPARKNAMRRLQTLLDGWWDPASP